jgi:hypothetical protein
VLKDSSNPTTVAPLQYAGADAYQERQPGWRRRFTLTDDRLLIHAKRFLGSEWEVPISLRMVDPLYSKVWKRSEIAGAGALILSAIFFALLGVMIMGPGPKVIGIVIDGGLGVLCLGTGLRCICRIELASFGHSGGARFDIARSGPDRDRFDAFVARIVDRVNSLRAAPITQSISDGSGPAADLIQIPQSESGESVQPNPPGA